MWKIRNLGKGGNKADWPLPAQPVSPILGEGEGRPKGIKPRISGVGGKGLYPISHLVNWAVCKPFAKLTPELPAEGWDKGARKLSSRRKWSNEPNTFRRVAEWRARSDERIRERGPARSKWEALRRAERNRSSRTATTPKRGGDG